MPTSHQTLFQCRERWNAWMQNCRKFMNGEAPALVQTRVPYKVVMPIYFYVLKNTHTH